MPKSDAVMLCRAAEVKEGTVVQVPKPGSDDFLAIYNLGEPSTLPTTCAPTRWRRFRWARSFRGGFAAPLHGGEFDIATGAAVEEPCTDPLMTYEIFEQDGVLPGGLERAGGRSRVQVRLHAGIWAIRSRAHVSKRNLHTPQDQ